jgi:hypothetical protein
MMLNMSSIIQRNPDILSAEANQDLVMVSIANGTYYGVSDVARDIWESIDKPTQVADLIDILMVRYDVDRSQCEEQALTFLEALVSESLVQVKND